MTSSTGSGLEALGATVEGTTLAVVAVVALTAVVDAVEAGEAVGTDDPVAPDPAGSVGNPTELLGAVDGTVTDVVDSIDSTGAAEPASVVLLLQPTPARRPVVNKP